jgi:hypothetical protein
MCAREVSSRVPCRSFRVDPKTGEQTKVGGGDALNGGDGLAVGPSGAIYVGTISYGTTPATVVVMNPRDGSMREVARDGALSLVEGLRVFH